MRTLLVTIALILGLAAPAAADDLADAKAFIGKQVGMIKKSDVAGLRAGFTRRQQDKVTADAVKKAQAEVDKYTLEDLVESVSSPDRDSIKIKMKNGRTLTTLIKVDGAWKADTIWFR
jgi:hypothetical protein